MLTRWHYVRQEIWPSQYPSFQNALYAKPFSEITRVLESNRNCDHASEYSLSSLNVNHTCTFASSDSTAGANANTEAKLKKKNSGKNGREVFGVFKQNGMSLYDFQYHSPPSTSTKLKRKIKQAKGILLRTAAATARYCCYRTFCLLPSWVCRRVICNVILCSEPPFCT